MKICVIGTGYVGLVTGTVFADLGNEVICVDRVDAKIKDLTQGKLPIYEPGLEEMVRRNLQEGRLSFTTDGRAAVEQSLIVFICVNTPPKSDGEADLSFVEDAAREIALAMNGYKVVVNKSTVPVGTGNLVRNIILSHRVGDHNFDVVSMPEFLREGSAVHDALKPDRIVIGAPSRRVAMVLLELYGELGCPVFVTDIKSAEIIKYASNAFLATKISFINAIADLCEATGADVKMVARGMSLDKRIGEEFLQAGLGYGGSCFPKDVDSLIHTMNRHGGHAALLRAVADINAARVGHFVNRVQHELGNLAEARIGILGLSFKPDTDDMREARSLEVIERLLKAGATLSVYDPAAMDNARRLFDSRITYAANAYDVALDADAVLLLTEWREFKSLDLQRLRGTMRRPYLFDGRNLYDPERTRRLGFKYFGVGISGNVEDTERGA